MHTQKQFIEARERFAALLEKENTVEREWQALFAEYPYIFSEALPVRIHPDDVHPLGRPGKSEADFIFFPREPQPLSPYGVIEIKRPSSSILRIPRRDVLTLSSDASTAFAQARKYAAQFDGEAIKRLDQVLIVGSQLHIFLIVGMSQEILRKVSSEGLRRQFEGLLPRGCQLIPFDTLLRTFDSTIRPKVHVLHTSLPIAVGSLAEFIRSLAQYYQTQKHYWFNDLSLDFWTDVESEFIRIAGPHAYSNRIFNYSGFEIIGSEPDQTGRRPIATESPNPSFFFANISSFISRAVQLAREFGIQSMLSDDIRTLWEGLGGWASD